MTADYVETPLTEKLGIRPGFRIAFINAPEDYMWLLGELHKEVDVVGEGSGLDLLQLFASNREQLVVLFPVAKNRIKKEGMLWVCWPKLKSPLASDLRDSVVREVGLANGMLDVKVVAIDADWTGVKFVFRRQDRG